MAKSDTVLLMDSLKGQRVSIPDIWPLYQGWHMGINKHHVDMVPIANAKLESLQFTGRKLTALKKADFSLITGVWWPEADFEEYRILTFLIMWLFIWDDLFEQLISEPSAGPARAEDYRKETVTYIHRCLGFGSGEIHVPSNVLINSFDVIGDALREAYNDEQRQTFLDALQSFFRATQIEQEIRLSDRIPSLQEFWVMRMGTIGVEPCLAMNEYALKKRLPSHIMQASGMQVLWNESIAGLAIVNDIMSLKKEMTGGSVLNLVPVSYAACNDAQYSVQASVDCLEHSIKNIRKASRDLLAMCTEGTEEQKALNDYITLVNSHATGNLYWSLRTDRYGMASYIGDDGAISLTL